MERKKIANFVRALTFTPLPNPLSPPQIIFKNGHFIVTTAKVIREFSLAKSVPGKVIEIKEILGIIE